MQSAPSQHPRIFLSASDDDEALARQLQHDLEVAGASVRATSGSARGAADVLQQYDYVVVILTPAAAASSRVQAEAFTALELQRAGQGSPRSVLLFVAKLVDPAAIPSSWASLQRVYAQPYYTAGLAELRTALGLSAWQSTSANVLHEPDAPRGWDGTLRDAAPDSADSASPQPANEEETVAPPPASGVDDATGAPPTVPAPPAWDTDESVRGWDDTPTILAPGRAEAPATEAAPPPEAARGGTPPPAPEWSDDTRVAGMLRPPAPPAPAPTPAQQPAPPAPPIYPAAPPKQSERDSAAPRGFPSGAPAPTPPTSPAPPTPPAYIPSPPGADVPDGAPAPGFGAPPHGYPPAQSYPPYPPSAGYAPPPAYGAPPNPMAPAPQGGYGYPGPFSPWPAAPAAPAAPVAVAEQVMFTAYHVREITPQAWEPLYVYIALDTPQAQAQVAASAQAVLAGRLGEFRPAMAAETSWLRRGTQLTFVPSVPGCVFNPPEQTVPWQADVQQLAFGMQAVTARPGFAANGSVQVFTGPLLRADIPLSVFVRQPGMYSQAQQQQRTFATTVARAYRKVFASYSHRDTSVVQSCETAAQVTGDRYLRDVTLLRGGEQWNDRLLQAIGEADLFQLFWSENAARSPAVQTEWRHALTMQPARGNFIRPVFWSRQPYPIPPELQAIHFERLSLARLGWGKLRIFVHDALGLG